MFSVHKVTNNLSLTLKFPKLPNRDPNVYHFPSLAYLMSITIYRHGLHIPMAWIFNFTPFCVVYLLAVYFIAWGWICIRYPLYALSKLLWGYPSCHVDLYYRWNRQCLVTISNLRFMCTLSTNMLLLTLTPTVYIQSSYLKMTKRFVHQRAVGECLLIIWEIHVCASVSAPLFDTNLMFLLFIISLFVLTFSFYIQIVFCQQN